MLALLAGRAFAVKKRHNNNYPIKNIPLEDNYRRVHEVGEYRTVYRSTEASSACAEMCEEGTSSASCRIDSHPTHTHRHKSDTTEHHWYYSDQARWHHWEDHGGLQNECRDVPEKQESNSASYPGQSPIDIDPALTSPLSNITMILDGSFGQVRPSLDVSNDGAMISVIVCADNSFDCKSTANFGSLPFELRGIDGEAEYYLKQIDFHWGSDSTKGSEHYVCGSPRPAEMQMMFQSIDPTPEDRSDPESGTAYVVVSTLIDVGDHDNAAIAPVLDAVFPEEEHDDDASEHDHEHEHEDDHDHELHHEHEEHHHQHLARSINTTAPTVGGVTFQDLLPTNYSSRFYAYAGSKTQPPCSQTFTWIVFEDTISVSEAQLEQLRSASTVHHTDHIHVHAYHALLYPFVAIAMGTLTLHVLTRRCSRIPYTMVVMLEGFLLDWLASTNNEGRLNSMQQSLRLWSKIDPHLLLYSFLPALLFGDVTTLNVHTFVKTFGQALVLAGPGVLLGTVLTALAVKYLFPYDWSFSYCMTLGSILSATDPVAVVSLLKAVGASTKLTMQITGESLLNDGTAMVVFTIFFDVSRGKPYSAMAVVEYFARMVLVSPLLGGFIGFVALIWMSRASQKHTEFDGTIQLSITIVTAYLAYYIGESVCKTSGILTTVSAGLVLAWRVWPFVVSAESLENVWEAIEYLGNTLLFSLAGVLTRRATASKYIDYREFVWCFVLYLVAMAVRAVMLLVMYPALKVTSEYGTKPADVAFMWWGGLRGAVGLALALFVATTLNENDNEDDNGQGDRLLFFVSGVAFLTLVINAPTSGPMLKYLNLVGIGKLEHEYVMTVRDKVTEAAQKEYRDVCLKLDHDGEDIIHYVSALKGIESTEKATPATEGRKNDAVAAIAKIWADTANGFTEYRLRRGFDALSRTHRVAFAKEATASKRNLERRGSRIVVSDGRGAASEDMALGIRYIREKREQPQQKPEPTDPYRIAIFREGFYRMVKAEYWIMIEEGQLPRKAAATVRLLESVDVALDDIESPLHDFTPLLPLVDQPIGGERQDQCLDSIDFCLPATCTWDKEVHYMLNYKKHEIIFYVLRAFALAHHGAQHKLVSLFGKDPEVPDTPEQIAVVEESQKQIEMAKERLDGIKPSIKSIVKSSIIAQNVLEIQFSTVHRFVEQGILTQIEAEEILEVLLEDRHKFRCAHRHTTYEVAKIAAHEEVAYNTTHRGEHHKENASERRTAHEAMLEKAISSKRLISGHSTSKLALDDVSKDNVFDAIEAAESKEFEDNEENTMEEP